MKKLGAADVGTGFDKGNFLNGGGSNGKNTFDCDIAEGNFPNGKCFITGVPTNRKDHTFKWRGVDFTGLWVASRNFNDVADLKGYLILERVFHGLYCHSELVSEPLDPEINSG